MKKVAGPLVAVVVIYLVSVLVLWLLSFIGPVSATIEGIVERGGGTIWFAAAGVVAAFLLIAALGLLGLYLILKLIAKAAPDATNNITQSIHLFGNWLSHL